MGKLLLTLALVAFSSGVLCSVVPNLSTSTLDQMKILNSSESGSTAALQLTHCHCKMSSPCMEYVQKPGYVVTTGIGAHKLHTRNMNWNDARISCTSEGGQLTIINSVEEATKLTKWMKRENVNRIWVGVHEHFGKGDWVTLAGRPVNESGYNTWTTRPDRPAKNDVSRNCASLMNAEGLSYLDCDNRLPYFCKIYIC